MYTIFINKPPVRMVGGGCVVSPEEGDMLEKIFEVKCLGYEDRDLPLTFNFYFTGEDREVKIAAGPSPSSGLFQLSFGVTRLFVVVADYFGAESERFFLSVKVRLYLVVSRGFSVVFLLNSIRVMCRCQVSTFFSV